MGLARGLAILCFCLLPGWECVQQVVTTQGLLLLPWKALASCNESFKHLHLLLWMTKMTEQFDMLQQVLQTQKVWR
jgi:hypothetical protein